MARLAAVIPLVFLLSLAVRASAEPPHQADIDACEKEAAAAGPLPAASPDTGKPDAPDHRALRPTDDSPATTPNAAKADAAATTPAEREVFAACLARHGYYKGYYHH